MVDYFYPLINQYEGDLKLVHVLSQELILNRSVDNTIVQKTRKHTSELINKTL